MIAATVFLVFLPTIMAGILTQPQAIVIVDGQDASLPCMLDNEGSDVKEVFWHYRLFNPNVDLEEDRWTVLPKPFGSRYSVAYSGNDRSMNISGMHPADEGMYRCSVVDECANGARFCRQYGGKLSFIVHNVSVHVPPRIIGGFRGGHPVTVNAGETLRLRCVAEGSPLKVKWLIDGVPVEFNARDLDVVSERNTTYNLERRKMEKCAEGTYRCNATNYLGSDAIWFHVSVSDGTPTSGVIKPTDCADRQSSDQTGSPTDENLYLDEQGQNGDPWPPEEEE